MPEKYIFCQAELDLLRIIRKLKSASHKFLKYDNFEILPSLKCDTTNILLDFSDTLINSIQRFFTTYDIIKDNNNSDG